MFDITDFQYDGISMLTYGLLTFTTAIIAYSTLADSGSAVSQMAEGVMENIQNPEKVFELNPVNVNKPSVDVADSPDNEELDQSIDIDEEEREDEEIRGGKKHRKKRGRTIKKRNSGKYRKNSEKSRKNKTHKKTYKKRVKK
jgi:hypothetical protein